MCHLVHLTVPRHWQRASKLTGLSNKEVSVSPVFPENHGADQDSLSQATNTGLLRDETLVLQGLLGYQDSINTPSGHQQPQLLGKKLENSPMRNVRFLSLDIDALQEHNHVIQQFHIGPLILDTQSLKFWD